MSFEPHPRVVVALFVLLLVAMWGVSRLEFVPHEGLEIVPTQANSGDEPHYLMVTNSLLFDHDFELTDDYQRVAQGGFEAGALFRGRRIQHHTMVVDRITGEHSKLRYPAFRWRNPDGTYHERMIPIGRHLVPEAEVYEVSSHPPAFPMLMAAILAPFHPSPERVEPDFALAMVFMGWLGTILTYAIARRSGLAIPYALLAVVILFASPWLAYSRSFYSEIPIGLALSVALFAYISDMPILAAVGVGLATWIKPPFVVVGFGFMAEMLFARRWRDLTWFSIVLSGSILAMCLFHYWLARTFLLPPAMNPLPAEPGLQVYRSRPIINEGFLSNLRTHLKWPFGHLMAFTPGLLWYAPWAVFAFWAVGKARIRPRPGCHLLAQISYPLFLYLLTLSLIGLLSRGFTPGYSYGPRYWVPLMPFLAIAFADAFAASAKWTRWCMATVALAGAVISLSGALRYPHLFEQPFYASLSPVLVKTNR